MTRLVVISALMLACKDTTGPATPRLTFFVERSAALAVRPTVTVEDGQRALAVGGDFLTPCANPGTIAAAVARQGATLTLTVQHRTGSSCARETVPLRYRALLTGIAPGEYTLRVVHRGDVYSSALQTDGVGTVLEETVQVEWADPAGA